MSELITMLERYVAEGRALMPYEVRDLLLLLLRKVEELDKRGISGESPK